MNITQGSKETILVDIGDRKGQVADLTGAGVHYSVRDKDDVLKVTNAVASVSGMQASCLIDTTLGGTWAAGKYRLYVNFVEGIDAPVLGPINFSVNP